MGGGTTVRHNHNSQEPYQKKVKCAKSIIQDIQHYYLKYASKHDSHIFLLGSFMIFGLFHISVYINPYCCYNHLT